MADTYWMNGILGTEVWAILLETRHNNNSNCGAEILFRGTFAASSQEVLALEDID